MRCVPHGKFILRYVPKNVAFPHELLNKKTYSIGKNKRLRGSMRPTTKDLAKEAGVSLATVDRVLNGRSGVKERTIKAVNEAIEKIGFVRNMQAANLARSKSYRFRFILPDTGGEFVKKLLASIEEANQSFSPESTSAQGIQIAVNDPHAISNYLPH